MLGLDPVWLGVMVGINLQTSFLTPPFGATLFYMRGVAPARISTADIWRGSIRRTWLQLAGTRRWSGGPGAGDLAAGAGLRLTPRRRLARGRMALCSSKRLGREVGEGAGGSTGGSGSCG